MKEIKSVGAAGALFLALGALAGCTGKGASEPAGAEGVAPARIELNEDAYRSAGIEVAPAGHHAVERELRLTGTLGFDAGRMSRVRAPSPRRSTSIRAAPGAFVRAGAAVAGRERPDLA